MKRSSPLIAYIPLPAVGFAKVATELSFAVVPMNSTVAAFLTDAFWPALLVSGGITIGALWQDLTNPGSGLRRLWNEQRRIFSIADFLCSAYHSGHSYSLRLQADGDFKAVKVLVRFTAVEKTTAFARGKHVIEWGDTCSGEMLNIPLASVSTAVNDQLSVWWGYAEEIEFAKGDRNARNQPDAITRIDIEAMSSWRKQRETIYAVCKNQNATRAQFVFWRDECEVLFSVT